VEDEATLNDDEECAARQIVRHVCVALKRYLEAHLCIKAENLRRTQFRETGGQLEPVLPPAKVSTEYLFMLCEIWCINSNIFVSRWFIPVVLYSNVYKNSLIQHMYKFCSVLIRKRSDDGWLTKLKLVTLNTCIYVV